MPIDRHIRTDERIHFRFPGNTAAPPPEPIAEPADNAAIRSLVPFPIRAKTISWTRNITAAASSDLAEEWDRGTAFLWIPVFLGAGALTYFSLEAEPALSALLPGLLVLSVFAFLSRNRLPAFLAIISLIFFVAGMTAGRLETMRKNTMMLGSAVTTRITGSVVALEHVEGGRVRLTVDLSGTKRPHLRYQPQRVRITARSIGEGIEPGIAITGLARLFPGRGPIIGHGYDFAFENYFDGVGANGFFLGAPDISAAQPAQGTGTRISAFIERTRLAIRSRIKKALPGEEGEIAAALITGMKRGISEETSETLRRTGLAHILSISGLHMALAAGTVMGILRALFALYPQFASRYPVRKYAAGTALASVFAYLLLSGAGVATQRSFTMLAIMLMALTFDRAAITMRNLAIAAIIMIAIAPHEIMGPSFHMSFAATAALIAAYAWWSERLSNKAASVPAGRFRTALGKIAGYTSALAMTSLVAGVATMVFAAFHFHRIAPLGLPANLAAMPVVSLLVMPPAVVAVLLMPFDLDGPALQTMGYGVGLVTGIARWFATRTQGDVIGMVPVPALAGGTVALVIATVTTTRWRMAAVPFALAGIVLFAQRNIPDVMVSDDAGLVAIANGNGALSINTPRPNAFVTGNWQRALKAGQLKKPVMQSVSNASAVPGLFHCMDGLCLAKWQDTVTIAHVENTDRLPIACAQADLVIVTDPAIVSPCGKTGRKNGPQVISARDLALYGTAAVRFIPVTFGPLVRDGKKPGVEIPGAGLLAADYMPAKYAARQYKIRIAHALESIGRPWHQQRRFSRAARGLGERRSATHGKSE